MKFCRKVLLLVLCGYAVVSPAFSQCTGAIATFPYQEGFESNNGNWLVGGSYPDWEWGTPAKATIHSAGSGAKCWIAGGLTKTTYNNNENSWLQSPCFDFTTLIHPQISFKIFWETEKKWDGGSIEYSLDGSNWVVLGTSNDNTNCSGVNWFNTPTVSGLSAGWSGNIQATSPCSGGAGGGSGGWVTAKHVLDFLAGKPSVLFRFRFAAGSQCNTYDGFAIDDVMISETQPQTPSFSYACSGNNTVAFTNTSSVCSSNFNWNFGDPASGANNISTQENPTHIFSAPGSYTISFSATFPGNITPPPATQTIYVPGVNIAEIKSINCYGDHTGELYATVAGVSVPVTYAWNTTPVQSTATITNIGAGTYSVTVSGTNVCTTIASYTLTEPAQLVTQVQVTDAKCNQNSGSAKATVTGGTIPYTYMWSNGNTTNSITNVPPGNYSLVVKDDNGCASPSVPVDIKNVNNPISVFLGEDTSFCPGNTLTLNAGTFASYEWQDHSTNATFTVTKTGKYWVSVKDADGCTTSDTILVNVDCSEVYFPSGFTPNNDGKNDGFGPLGNVAGIKKYSFTVYNRWGQIVFASSNPYEKWDGKFKGTDIDLGSYVWFATYTLNYTQRTQKGIVTLIR